MAERKKKAPAKALKPEAMTGTVPEWANTTVIAQLLGKTARRIQQLTQEGVLETEVPPGGGARKYKTCETVHRYIAHVEEKAKENGEKSRTAELTLKKLEAEVELKESQGELHRMKTAIAKGEYTFPMLYQKSPISTDPHSPARPLPLFGPGVPLYWGI